MPEDYNTHKYMTNALVGWSAVLVGFNIMFQGELLFYLCAVFSVIFWIVTLIYLYRKTHKKIQLKEIGLEPSIVPLTPETVEKNKPQKVKHPKRTFIKNFFFITLGIVESIYLLSFPILFWEIVTIPVDGLHIPVLTYQNAVLIFSFVYGSYIAFITVRRLRHPRKAFFED